MPVSRAARPAIALALWSLFVWGVRVRNAAADDAVGSVVLAGTFVVLAVAVLVAAWRARRWLAPAVAALAAWTTGVWLIRGGTIWARDHAVAFKVVHTVLAVVSIALAVWAVRSVDGLPRLRRRVAASS